MKLAIFATHPIQYQAPLHRRLASIAEFDVTVYFGTDYGVRRQKSLWGSDDFAWDVDLLAGYTHRFLSNLSFKTAPSTPWSCINPGIVGALVRDTPDALFLYSYTTATAWLAWATAQVLGVPVYFRGESRPPAAESSLKSAVKRLLLGFFFKGVAGACYIGKLNRDFLVACGLSEDRLEFAPYCVDDSALFRGTSESMRARERVRAELGLGADDVAVLFSGVFIERKRPWMLIQAADLLRNSRLKLVFMGDGPMGARFRERHGQRSDVRIVGFKNQTEIADYYSAADVFCLPSAEETWGLVVNEAMCCGLPVIVSDRVGAAADLVRDGENGYVFHVDDAQSLADALAPLLESPALRRRLGESSAEIIRAYSFDECVEGVRRLLRRT